jgi:hypothetical protein
VPHEGTGWVLRPDGAREAIEAQSVVIWGTGDWVEYCKRRRRIQDRGLLGG